MKGFPGAVEYEGDSILEEECDILCPCAVQDIIHSGNAGRIKAKIIVEGANGPITPQVERTVCFLIVNACTANVLWSLFIDFCLFTESKNKIIHFLFFYILSHFPQK